MSRVNNKKRGGGETVAANAAEPTELFMSASQVLKQQKTDHDQDTGLSFDDAQDTETVEHQQQSYKPSQQDQDPETIDGEVETPGVKAATALTVKNNDSSSVTEYVHQQGLSEYQQANNALAYHCRVKWSKENNVWHYTDFLYEKMIQLTCNDTGNLRFKYEDDDHNFSGVQTPLGVLSWSCLDYDGNRFADKYGPAKPHLTKQSIQWSAYKFDAQNVAEDGVHDKTALDFIAWIKHFSVRWFLDNLKKLFKSACCKTVVSKITQELQESGIKKPTPEQILKVIETSKFNKLATLTNRGVWKITSSTGLVRKPNKRDVKEIAQYGYRAPTPWLQTLYEAKDTFDEKGKLETPGGHVFNDVPIYRIKTQEEMEAGWPHDKTIYKLLDRKTMPKIEDGTIGALRFSPSPTEKAGVNFAVMAYLSAVIIYSPPNDLSRSLPEMGDPNALGTNPFFIPGAKPLSLPSAPQRLALPSGAVKGDGTQLTGIESSVLDAFSYPSGENGHDMEEVYDKYKFKEAGITPQEYSAIVKKLWDEGMIYSTIDETHWKATQEISLSDSQKS